MLSRTRSYQTKKQIRDRARVLVANRDLRGSIRRAESFHREAHVDWQLATKAYALDQDLAATCRLAATSIRSSLLGVLALSGADPGSVILNALSDLRGGNWTPAPLSVAEIMLVERFGEGADADPSRADKGSPTALTAEIAHECYLPIYLAFDWLGTIISEAHVLLNEKG